MTFAGEKLYKYVKVEMESFLRINVTELIPHLHCLTQMDQERVRAIDRMEGNEAAVPILLDLVRRRRNWERQLINALRRNEYEDLAVGLENEFHSLAPRRQSAPGGPSVRFPTQATADKSSVRHVSSPSRSQSVAPGGPSPTLVVAGDQLAFPDAIPPAAHLQPGVTGLQPTVQGQHSVFSTPAPSPPAPQLVSNTPMLNASVQSTTAPQPVPNTPMLSTPVQSTVVLQPVPDTPIVYFDTPVQSTTVPLSVPDTLLPNTPGQSTPVVGTQVPNTPAQSTPCPQTVPGTSSLRSPGTQATPSTPVSGTPVPPRSDMPAAVSNACGESSSVSSRLSRSIECRVPVQELGNLLDREESTDCKLPVQEKTVRSAQSNPSDISNLQLNQTKPLNQGNAGDKCNIPSTDRAKGEPITEQAVATVPPPSIQLHLPWPPPEASADDLQTMDRPGALRSDVENLPEGSCSLNSSALQISTTDMVGNHGMGGTAPINRYPGPTSTLTRISEEPHDENSVKEQKIRALRGYQNDHLQEEFYDVNNPSNIQRNFDALKKAAALNEDVGLAQGDMLNQNLEGEFSQKNKPNPISSSEVTQGPAFTSSHPGDNEVASAPEFIEPVQPSDSNSIISSGELMFSSGSSANSSFQNSSADSDIETSAAASQDPVHASPQKNHPESLYSDVQVPAWTEGANRLRQNPTLEHDNEPEYTGEVARHLSRPGRFTEADSGEESSQDVDVSAGENSFHANYEESHGKHYFNTEDGHISACNQDVKEHTGHIHQEPSYENEAGNVREFEAGNTRDYAEEVSTDVLSNKHVPLASQQRSQSNLPEKPTGDSRQPDYVLVSTIVLVFTIVAGFVWKHYHK